MRLAKAVLLALPLLWASPALADGQCRDQPAPVRAYLKAHSEWSPVRYGDLGNYRSNWQTPDICPGIVTVDLAANGRPYFGLALLRRQGPDRFAQVVLLSPEGISPVERTLRKETNLGHDPWSPLWVIEPGEPGIYPDHESAERGGATEVRIGTPVLHVTDLDKDSSIYYFKNGRLIKVVTQG